MWWFDTHKYEMVTTIRSVNTFFTSYYCHFVVTMVTTLKLYSHSNFQICNTVLFTIVIILWHISSLEHIHLVIESYNCTVNQCAPFSSSLNCWQLTFYFVSSMLLDCTYKWYYTVFFSVWLNSRIIMPKVCQCYCKWQDFLLFMVE